MDQLITIIIVLLVSAGATLLKKLKQNQERQDLDSPPINRPRQPRPQSAPQRPTTSWEDELRRLLGDESAPPPSAPRPPPAPVISRPPPATIAPPAHVPTPVVRAPSPIQSQPRPQPQRQPQATPAPRPRVVIRSAPISPPMQVLSRAEAAEAAMLSEEAYRRAAQLNQETSARLGSVTGGPIQSTVVERRAASEEITQVVGLFKSARGARQAVIASIILGPPPALEPSSSYF